MQPDVQDQHIFYSATTFRLLLDSLARPGKINQLEYPHSHSQSLSTEVPVNFYALGALLTLLDGEVSFVVAANGRWQAATSEIVQWLVLRSDASVAKPEMANFAFFCDSSSISMVAQLNVGTLLEPEESATAFCCVEQLASTSDDVLTENENWLTLELSGPGILTHNIVHVAGLDRAEIGHINTTRQQYPLGIDVYMVDASGRCIGLPRTTHINVAVATRQARG